MLDFEGGAPLVEAEEQPEHVGEAPDGLIEALEKELLGWRELYSESGQMGTACKYLENHRDHLRVFLDDARVPIHNNACEVAIRPVAVGPWNWLFAGSRRGGRAAATIYTLVESCDFVGLRVALTRKSSPPRAATARSTPATFPASWARRGPRRPEQDRPPRQALELPERRQVEDRHCLWKPSEVPIGALDRDGRS